LPYYEDGTNTGMLVGRKECMEGRIIAKTNIYLESMESHMNAWRKETTA
jgi:hypothetical protein